MLEIGSWIAGIVVAVVAVLTIFRRDRTKRSLHTQQSAKVSGDNNTVVQSSKFRSGKGSK